MPYAHRGLGLFYLLSEDPSKSQYTVKYELNGIKVFLPLLFNLDNTHIHAYTESDFFQPDGCLGAAVNPALSVIYHV